MKLSKRFLSAILTVAMLLTSAPLTAGAEAADAVVYDTVLFEQDFDGIAAGTSASELEYLTHQATKSTVTDTVESAAAVGINGADDHGNVVQLHKTDSGEISEDNYFRLYYRNAGAIKGAYGLVDGMFLNAPQVLGKVKTSIDVYYKGTVDILNLRFYDNLTGEGTLKAENLASIQPDGAVKLADATKVPELVIQPDTWYTLDFELNFDTDTYSLAINGTTCASGVSFAVLDTCITSFGIQNNTKNAYDIYLDNMYFAASDVVPQSTNTVWENNFDSIEATDGVLPSGSSTENNAAIDYRPENVNWAIRQEADGNKYYYLEPKNTTSVPNSGNRMDGYFKASETDVRAKDEDGNTIEKAALDLPSSWDETPYAIDKFAIDKLRLDMSVKFESLINAQICSYYRGTMYGGFNSANKLFHFNNNGVIGIGVNNTWTDTTYEAGKWIDISMYVDYANHYAVYYMDDEFVGVTALPETLSHFNQIRLRLDKATTETLSDYGVSVDNIRYSTTYNEDYINRKLSDIYTSDIAKLDFDDEAAGAVIGRDTKPGKYYFNSDDTATISYDDDIGSNAALLSSANANEKFGIGTDITQSYITYQQTGSYPDIVKAEVQLKKVESSQAVYVYFGDTELLIYNGSNQLRFSSTNDKNRLDSGINVAVGTWVNVAFIMNFADGKYEVYIDGNYAADYALPSNITTPELMTVSSNSAENNVMVDTMSLSTLPEYEVAADYIIGDIELAVNGDTDSAMFTTGTVDASIDVANYTDDELQVLVAVAQYDETDGSIVKLAIEKTTVSPGKATADATLDVTESKGTYIRAFAMTDAIRPIAQSVTMYAMPEAE